MITWSWPSSGACEDDQSLGRPGHRDIAVDRSLDARAERLRVDQDDQVELEPFRQFRGQRPDAGRRQERGIADDAGDAVVMRGEPRVEDRAQLRSRPGSQPSTSDLPGPASGAGEDDELLGRPGHRDIAVDRPFDAAAESLQIGRASCRERV